MIPQLSRFFVITVVCSAVGWLALHVSPLSAEETASLIGKQFVAKDTLGKVDEDTEDARECLSYLCWSPAEFNVEIESDKTERADYIVRFPSPVSTGNKTNDLVALEWYMPKDDDGQPMEAPAVVIVHESGSGMDVGRLFAQGLRSQGLHTFMVQLPGYGLRKSSDKATVAQFITTMRQGVADVRRSRDALSVLPLVQGERVALQGTSLGGFVASNSAALDDGFDGVFLLLSGGNLFELIQNGKKDAAKVRERLAAEGLEGDKLKEVLWKVEPTRIAHRLNKERTWLYSGTFDTVVPLPHAVAMAKAAGLGEEHHIRMPANHYTGIVFMPFILQQIKNRTLPAEMNPSPEAKPEAMP